MPRGKEGGVSSIVVLMTGVVIVLIALAVAFLPFRTATLSETRDVPAQTGFGNAVLNITSDVGNIKVICPANGFLDGNLVQVQISATAGVGLLSARDISSIVNVTFQYTIVENTLYVTVGVKNTQGGEGFGGVQNLSVVVLVDPSLEASIYAKTTTGEVQMVSGNGEKVDYLRLSSTTGQVDANLSRNTMLRGGVNLATTTGGVSLLWDDVKTDGNVAVSLGTITGEVSLDMKQSGQLQGNATVDASCTTGSIDLNLALSGNASASIESHVMTGSIDLSRQTGFTGSSESLLSPNYPEANNLDINLGSTLGNIDLDVFYQP
jgi:hypothetical protein